MENVEFLVGSLTSSMEVVVPREGPTLILSVKAMDKPKAVYQAIKSQPIKNDDLVVNAMEVMVGNEVGNSISEVWCIDTTSVDVNPSKLSFVLSRGVHSKSKLCALIRTRARNKHAQKCFKAKTSKFNLNLCSDVGLDTMKTLSTWGLVRKFINKYVNPSKFHIFFLGWVWINFWVIFQSPMFY